MVVKKKSVKSTSKSRKKINSVKKISGTKKRVASKKKGFLNYQYKKSFEYLRESKDFIFISIYIFLFFTLIGFFLPAPEIITERILEFLKEMIEETEGMGAGELVRFIFINNLMASFMAILFGVFLGLFPIFASAINGYLLGFVAKIAVFNEGIFVLWRILPHGIFELPAIFISFGLGIKFGMFLFGEEIGKSFWEYLVNSLRVFVFIVFPLLVVAAIIEGILIAFMG